MARRLLFVTILLRAFAALADEAPPSPTGFVLPPRPTLAVLVRTTMPSSGQHVTQMAFDGNLDSYFLSKEAPKAGDTFTLTFATPSTVSKVEALTGLPGGGNQLADGVLEVSADGTTFTEAAKVADGRFVATPGKLLTAVRLRATADGKEPLAIREILVTADPAIPTFRHPFEVRIQCEVPEMQAWCEKCALLCETWWPLYCDMLPSEGFKPPVSLTFHYVKDMKGVAYTSGGGIYCADGWFHKRQYDVGAVAHELTHWQQQYRGGGQGWLTEGIAEYMRYYIYEPPAKPRRINPDRFKPDTAYGWDGSAALLNWLVCYKDKDAVVKLNAASRKRPWRDAIWQELFGKTLAELAEEFKAAVRAGTA
jgi:hypothetical protein